jgi:WhiB family redox-sensing transcriptional regulator
MGPRLEALATNTGEQLRHITDTDWETHAVCRSVDNAGDLFFSEDIGDIAAAKRVCAECPVLAPCLEGALDRREPWGVWGGQLFMNGKMLTVKRRRGRPPKVARPEDQMPNVPVPDHLVAQAERLTA